MKKTNVKRIFFLIFFLLIIPIFSTWILVAQPTFTKNSPSHLTLENSRLKAHVFKLSKDCFPRCHTNTINLDRCADYILAHFKKAGADTSIQEFTVLGKKYQNVIGFFNNVPDSQSYPIPALKIFYPNKGNFIAIVGRLDQRKIVKKIKGLMKGATDLPVYSVNAPLMVPGIDFSDHRNYWQYGYDAVMITDTAFFRNQEYHKPGDTAERLNYELMGKAVIQVFEAIKGLAKGE